MTLNAFLALLHTNTGKEAQQAPRQICAARRARLGDTGPGRANQPCLHGLKVYERVDSAAQARLRRGRFAAAHTNNEASRLTTPLSDSSV